MDGLEQAIVNMRSLSSWAVPVASVQAVNRVACSGQLKLATVLEFFRYRFSDSFGGNPPLYSCGLSSL